MTTLAEAAAQKEALAKVEELSQVARQIGQISGQIVNVIGTFESQQSAATGDDVTELDTRFNDVLATSVSQFNSSLSPAGKTLLTNFFNGVVAGLS